jgi:uncharacterized protein
MLRSGLDPRANANRAILSDIERIDPYLEIRDSSIAGAGKGLFTLIDLPADKPITLYFGVITRDIVGGYCLNISQHYTLDARPITKARFRGKVVINKGRFVNDSRGSNMTTNMKYCHLLQASEADASHSCVVMYSKRKIKSGEELLASYGYRYWRVHNTV